MWASYLPDIEKAVEQIVTSAKKTGAGESGSSLSC
jgi:hypothetical protein